MKKILVLCISLFAFNANATDIHIGTLTDEEHRWLDEHPVIKLAPDPDFMPFEGFDENGNYIGLAANYIHLLEKKLGIKFEIKRLPSWGDAVKQAYNRDVDMWGMATPTTERLEHMQFTEDYLRLPAEIFMRTDHKHPNATLETLADHNYEVGVIDGYGVHEWLKENHPDIKLKPYKNVSELLQAVSFGEIDAAIVQVAIASYELQQKGLTNLRIAGTSGFEYTWGIASRNDWPMFNQILNKGLATITDDERREIHRNWISPNDHFLWGLLQWLELLAVVLVVTVVVSVFWMLRFKSIAKTTKSHLEVEKDRLETLTTFVPIAIFRTDNNGKVTFANKAWLDLAGMKSIAEATGDRWKIAIHEDDRERVFQGWKDFVSGKSDFSTNYKYITPEGIIRHCMTKVAIEYDVDENISGYIGAVTDMTEQHEHTLELTRAKAEAEHGNRTKLEFLATMSHELRTPLNAVIGFSGVMMMELKGKMIPEYAEWAVNINDSGKHLLDLINDILEVSKIESGKMELKLEEVNARALMDFIEPIYEEKCRDKHFDFEIMPKFKNSLTFRGDDVKIKQVLTNLLNNAIKFTNEGGVAMECWCDDKGIQFTVVDTGIGIPKDQLEAVFEPFVRTEHVKNHAIEGSGLGLSIVKRILDLHGFKISVTSDVGIGTQIYVTIPPEKIIAY